MTKGKVYKHGKDEWWVLQYIAVMLASGEAVYKWSAFESKENAANFLSLDWTDRRLQPVALFHVRPRICGTAMVGRMQIGQRGVDPNDYDDEVTDEDIAHLQKHVAEHFGDPGPLSFASEPAWPSRKDKSITTIQGGNIPEGAVVEMRPRVVVPKDIPVLGSVTPSGQPFKFLRSPDKPKPEDMVYPTAVKITMPTPAKTEEAETSGITVTGAQEMELGVHDFGQEDAYKAFEIRRGIMRLLEKEEEVTETLITLRQAYKETRFWRIIRLLDLEKERADLHSYREDLRMVILSELRCLRKAEQIAAPPKTTERETEGEEPNNAEDRGKQLGW